MKKTKRSFDLPHRFALASVGLFLILAFLCREAPGLSFDQGTFMAWTLRFREVSLWHFYQKDYFCDYLPGYLLILNLMSYVLYLTQKLGINSYFAIRLPSLLACTFFAYFVPLKFAEWNEWKKKPKWFHYLLALPLSLCPALLYDVLIFGQVDPYFCFFTFLWLYSFLRGHLILSSILYGYLLVTKPQSLFFLPFWAMALSFYFYKTRDWKLLAQSIALTLAVPLIFLLPFWILHPMGAFDQYVEGLKSYNYATVNAFNFFLLINANWFPMEQALWGPLKPAHLTAITLLIFVAMIGYRYKVKRKNFFKITNEELLVAGALVLTHVFFFFPKMHERYCIIIFPFYLFIAMRSYGLYAAYLFFSLAAMGNQIFVMKHYDGPKIPIQGFWTYAIAVGFLLSYLLLVAEWVFVCRRGRKEQWDAIA